MIRQKQMKQPKVLDYSFAQLELWFRRSGLLSDCVVLEQQIEQQIEQLQNGELAPLQVLVLNVRIEQMPSSKGVLEMIAKATLLSGDERLVVWRFALELLVAVSLVEQSLYGVNHPVGASVAGYVYRNY
jgi:hypothetical protein